MRPVSSRKHNFRRSRQSTILGELVLIQAPAERRQHRKRSPGGSLWHRSRDASTAAACRLDKRDVGDQVDQADVQWRIRIDLDIEGGRVEDELPAGVGGWRFGGGIGETNVSLGKMLTGSCCGQLTMNIWAILYAKTDVKAVSKAVGKGEAPTPARR